MAQKELAKSPSRVGVSEEIASSLRKAIVQGRFRPGDPLPSERELADKYEVNRSSIREAMTRLDAWGLVSIRQGGVTRVTDFLLSAGLDLLPHLVEIGVKIDSGVLRDLHEIRAMLLGWCAEQAAVKADASSIARLEELSRRLADPRSKPAVLQDLDYAFFQELVQITGNRLLALFSNMVREVYLRGREKFISLYDRPTFDPRHHQLAVEAIRLRNPAKAGEEMRAHALSAMKTLEVGT
jgi:DNA-binding FadR family transcriptional regulator